MDCRNSQLAVVPSTAPTEDTNWPIHLLLDNNNIVKFNNVSYLNRISKLTMTDNDLKELPEFVIQAIARGDNPEIDFRNNQLKTIPKSTQNMKYQNAKFTGNRLECSCEMLWMTSWIKRAPNYVDKGELNCTFEGNVHKIIDLNESILKCYDFVKIILIVVSAVALALVVAVIIFAKRCPYETKVIIFRLFRIHPADKYKIDETTNMQYDMYVSFDENDDYVRQWVMKILFKVLEEKKPKYKLCTQMRNGGSGPESESRLDLIEKSRRLLIILSRNFERRRWNDYDLCHAEKLEQNEGRVMFILYDQIAIENSSKEPLASKLKERKVFNVHDRLLWSKLRYELPRQPCGSKPKTKPTEEFMRY